MIDITDEISGDSLSNFSLRKSFVYYDPYEPDQSVAHTYLKFEDSHKLRASIVLDYYSKEVSAISDDSISLADKERKEQVL